MFRNHILLFLLVSFLQTFTYAQVYEVDYKVKVHKNRKQLNGVSEFTQLVFDEMDSLNMKLFFDQEKSIFKYPDKREFDKEKKRIFNMASRLIIGLTHTYYYDLKESEGIEIKEFNGIDYVIESKIPSSSWHFTKEEKLVNGHRCHKAIMTKERTDRKGVTENLEIVAWYTNELPYSFGPKNYVGLPGLILELHEGSNRFSYIIANITLNPIGKIDFTFPERVETITKEDFNKIVENGSVLD